MFTKAAKLAQWLHTHEILGLILRTCKFVIGSPFSYGFLSSEIDPVDVNNLAHMTYMLN